jgi:hypothetical protein
MFCEACLVIPLHKVPETAEEKISLASLKAVLPNVKKIFLCPAGFHDNEITNGEETFFWKKIFFLSLWIQSSFIKKTYLSKTL